MSKLVKNTYKNNYVNKTKQQKKGWVGCRCAHTGTQHPTHHHLELSMLAVTYSPTPSQVQYHQRPQT